MKRIAILGSGSFLARNFIKYSLENNLVYQFEMYDYCERNEWPQFNFKKIDFYSLESIREIDFLVDTIMIYIGKTGTTIGFEDYKSFIEVNELILLNILQVYNCVKSKARIIYPSSRLVFKSNENNRVDEYGERACKSIYAITKQASEEYLKIYKETFGIQSVIIRICTPMGTLLGNFGNYGTFEIFKKQALENHEITIFGDGFQRKTFTIMQDICRAFSLVIDCENVMHSDYNLGGQELSLLDIAKKIADEYSIPIRHVPWPELYKKVDGGSVVFDSTRFDQEFNMKYTEVIGGV